MGHTPTRHDRQEGEPRGPACLLDTEGHARHDRHAPHRPPGRPPARPFETRVTTTDGARCAREPSRTSAALLCSCGPLALGHNPAPCGRSERPQRESVVGTRGRASAGPHGKAAARHRTARRARGVAQVFEASLGRRRMRGCCGDLHSFRLGATCRGLVMTSANQWSGVHGHEEETRVRAFSILLPMMILGLRRSLTTAADAVCQRTAVDGLGVVYDAWP